MRVAFYSRCFFATAPEQSADAALRSAWAGSNPTTTRSNTFPSWRCFCHRFFLVLSTWERGSEGDRVFSKHLRSLVAGGPADSVGVPHLVFDWRPVCGAAHQETKSLCWMAGLILPNGGTPKQKRHDAASSGRRPAVTLDAWSVFQGNGGAIAKFWRGTGVENPK